MKRSNDSASSPCGDDLQEKKFRGTVVIPGDVTTVTLEGVQVTSPILGLHPDSTAEVIQIEDGTSAIIAHDIHSSSDTDSSLGIIAQHMDITEPLTTLRAQLEHELGFSLSDYRFYLQDAQELDASKNLVNQCVQGEGLVQINVDITNKGGLKKINIVDVLKPAEEIVALSSDFVGQGNEAVGEPAVVRKVVIPVAEETEQVTRWMVAPEFRQLQDKLKIPLDPLKWTEEHVRHWIEWAALHFNLSNVNLNDWNITGKQLVQLTHVDFVKKVPYDPGDLFWTHLELLRKCKIVAIVQQPTYVHQLPQVLTSVNKNLSLKNRVRSPRIGAPRIAYEGCPGNHIGNNGQIQLWQFLLELLTDKDHREYIQWVGDEGEFKLINPEMVAQLWGQRKNKPTMNYEKLSRALRYYYDGEMIAKVHGKRFVYKFVCDLKGLLGYDASELNKLVSECEQKKLEKMQSNLMSFPKVEVAANSSNS